MAYRTTMYGAPTINTYTHLCRHKNADAKTHKIQKRNKSITNFRSRPVFSYDYDWSNYLFIN